MCAVFVFSFFMVACRKTVGNMPELHAATTPIAGQATKRPTHRLEMGTEDFAGL